MREGGGRMKKERLGNTKTSQREKEREREKEKESHSTLSERILLLGGSVSLHFLALLIWAATTSPLLDAEFSSVSCAPFYSILLASSLLVRKRERMRERKRENVAYRFNNSSVILILVAALRLAIESAARLVRLSTSASRDATTATECLSSFFCLVFYFSLVIFIYFIFLVVSLFVVVVVVVIEDGVKTMQTVPRPKISGKEWKKKKIYKIK